MHYADLRAALKQEPFVPFRLHLADGRFFDVPNPRWMIVMRLESSVALPSSSSDPENGIVIRNDQIQQIEPSPVPAVPRN